MLSNRSAPPVTVTPVLEYPDVRAAVAFLESAFGSQERVRIGDYHRSQMSIGADGAMIAAEAKRDGYGEDVAAYRHLIKVRVEDVDAAFARARAAGANVVKEPETFEYGERACEVTDLAGHRWELQQTLRDVAPEELGATTINPW